MFLDNIYVEKLDHQGRGIAHYDGFPIFIKGALANEIVNIEITKEKKKYKEAKITKIIKNNPNRKQVDCPYYEKCGGCDLRHFTYIETLQYKEDKIKEIIKKFYKQDIVINPIVYDEENFYRNKVTLKVINNKIGFYEKESYHLVPIQKCMIVQKKINSIIEICQKIPLKNIEEIIIRSAYFNESSLIAFKVRGKIDEKIIIEMLKNYVDSIVLISNVEKVIYGPGIMVEKINSFHFKISPQSFFQVNSKMMIKLYDKVKSYFEDKKTNRVLDYYCGAGTIGIYISSMVKEVVGVEINESSYNDALENKRINKIDNINFYCQNANTFRETDFDVVIVDPPRSGLDEKTRNHLKKIKASKIIYVSCDPITLARDLKCLDEYYEVSEITPFDLFPNTYHVETVSLLNLRKNLL